MPRSTANSWYRDRDGNGYPEKAGRIGRTDYWFEDEWTAWLDGHRRGRVAALTDPDRTGDPDDLVDAAGAAKILRYKNGHVIHSNRRLGRFPEPDAHGTTVKGRAAPLWKRSTVWAVAGRRVPPGGGRPEGSPGPAQKAHPYEGDPRLAQVTAILRSGAEPSAAELAASWAVSRRTAERVIRAARDLR